MGYRIPRHPLQTPPDTNTHSAFQEPTHFASQESRVHRMSMQGSIQTDSRYNSQQATGMRQSSNSMARDSGARGGVGLVFRKDEGPMSSSFLIVAEVVGGGPADKSGMIKAGDRLRKIDQVELGSAPPEQSPQLPGLHGSEVTLTLERPSRGSFFDPTVGILSYNIKLVRNKLYFPDKLQSTAEAAAAKMKEHQQAQTANRYGGGGSGWYSSGYEKLAFMAASIAEEEEPADKTLDESLGLPSGIKVYEQTRAMPRMIDHMISAPDPIDQSLSDEDKKLLEEAEAKHVRDELEGLKKYVTELQKELASKSILETKVSALERDLDRERGEHELRATKDTLRERQLQAEIEALRNQDNEVDLKVLVKGKLDQLVREKEILLLDLRHQQQQHRNATKALEEQVAKLEREKDDLRIDARLEADTERQKYQEYHAKSSAAMRALAQDLADAVKEKEDTKTKLSKFYVGDGITWEEETLQLKQQLAAARAEIEAEKLHKAEASKKSEQLAKEVLRLRSELKKGGMSRSPSDAAGREEATPPLKRAPPPPPGSLQAHAPPAMRSPPLHREFVQDAPPPPPRPAQNSPPAPPSEREPARGDITDDIMSMYLNGASPTKLDVRADAMNAIDDEGEEGPFPTGKVACVVQVEVKKARHLPASKQLLDSGSYVVVKFKDTVIGTTSTKRGELLVWNDSFKESLKESNEGLVSILLYQGGGAKEQFIGYVAVPLIRVIENGNEEGWYDLIDEKNVQIEGIGGSAEVLVKVSCNRPSEHPKSMSGRVRSQKPETGKELSPLQTFVWVLDPYAGVIKSSRGMSSATEIGTEEFRLQLREWELIQDQSAVRSVAGRVQNGVDGLCMLLSRTDKKATILVEVNSETKREYWIRALLANTAGKAASPVVDDTPPPAKPAQVEKSLDVDLPVHVLEPAAVVDVRVLTVKDLPVEGITEDIVCDVCVGAQSVATMPAKASSSAEWQQSVQVGTLDPNGEQLSIKVREVGGKQRELGTVSLGPIGAAGKGDGWVGLKGDGWVDLGGSDAKVRVNVNVRRVNAGELKAVTGWIGAVDTVDAADTRRCFAVLDPYTQHLRLYKDTQVASKAEEGRLAGQGEGEGVSRIGVRSCEVTSLPPKQGAVPMLVQAAEGEYGSQMRLVAESEAEYNMWRDAIAKVAENPPQKKLPMVVHASPVKAAAPPPTPPAEPEPAPAAAPAAKPPVGLFDVEVHKPVALLEVFSFRAQHLPQQAEGVVVTVWGVVRVGDESSSTRKLEVDSKGCVIWDEAFQLGARGEASDLVTIVLWAKAHEPSDAESVCLGHIAVPVTRVATSGQEEGWYEIRDKIGQVVKGASGQPSMLRAGIFYRNIPEELKDGHARIAGWLAMDCLDGVGGQYGPRKVVGVLNPFRERLELYLSDSDARAGRNCVEDINLVSSACKTTREFPEELRLVVAAEAREGVWQEGFAIERKGKTVVCIVEETKHVQAWLEALAIAGPGCEQRREAHKKAKQQAAGTQGPGSAGASASVEKAKAPTSDASPTVKDPLSSQGGEVVEVVVERARNLQGVTGSEKGEVKGFLCSVKMRNQKHATSLSTQLDGPIWKERFVLKVADAAEDLATVLLYLQGESEANAECLGHIAVPVSRISKKGKEEGWYDVTSPSGELLSNATGKTGLLVSFRHKAPDSSQDEQAGALP